MSEATAAGVEEVPPPDPRKLPNFDALRGYANTTLSPVGAPAPERLMTWIDKLQGWAEESIKEIEAGDKLIDERDQKIRDLEQAAIEEGGARMLYDDLVEALEDVQRGIKTVDEIMASVQ